ncbi:MAG: cytochrome-c peroxidase, partial [Cellvibrionaceae bacterium]|nr:cytochrome-c peroxidase [Cellvibrionaceae bacterium]
LSQAEKQGLQAFMQTGCYGCHNGALLDGSSFQKIGLAKPFPNTRDLGRFLITGAAADKFVFKVPSLRDVSRSAPYFHDGSAKTLEQAIVAMAWHQLGISLDAERVASIATFLRALENTKRLQ